MRVMFKGAGVALIGTVFLATSAMAGESTKTPRPGAKKDQPEVAQNVEGLKKEEGEDVDVPMTQVRKETYSLASVDPIQAEPGKKKIAISGEFWYFKERHQSKYGRTTDIVGQVPGGTIAFGYDKTTAMFSYKQGTQDGNATSTRGYSFKDTVKRKEYEFRLRQLVDVGSDAFAPYLIGTLNQTELDASAVLSSGWTWTNSGTGTLKRKTTFKSALVGIGGILDLSGDGSYGLRGDGSIGWVDIQRKYSKVVAGGVTSLSGSGPAAVFHGTAFVNFPMGFNAQAGVKGVTYQPNAAAYLREEHIGAYASIGWSKTF